MNAVQLYFSHVITRFFPPLGRLLKSSRSAVERLDTQNQLYREMLFARREETQGRIRDLQEAMALHGGGWLARTTDGRLDVTVRENDAPAVVQCKESIADLQLALEDRGWRRETDQARWEFSRWGIQQIILLCRLYRIKNPLVQRGILVSAYYVFGRGFAITSKNKIANDVINDFINDPRNVGEIGQRALIEKEAAKYTDGNIFWCFFAAEDGRTLIRHIDPLEIEEIISDPNDSSVPLYYHRRWTEQEFRPESGNTLMLPRDEWYVALGNEKPAGAIAGKPLFANNGELVPIYHTKSGGLLKWKYGVPRAYAALDWARAYTKHLEDFATVSAALAKFSWDVSTEGGAPAIAALKATLATTLGVNSEQGYDQNPLGTGSAFVAGPGTKLTPFKTAGMLPNPEGGRRLALMVFAVFGLPETFFSDVSVGTLATGQSLDRPTELKFKKEQEDWREDLQRIMYYVLDRSKTAPTGRMREVKNGAAEEITVDVKFPAIIENDPAAQVAAIVDAITLGGHGDGIDLKTGIGLLLTQLGVEEVADVLEEMFPDASYDPDRTEELAAKKDLAINPPEPVMVAPGAKPKPKVSAKEARTARAVAALLKAAKELKS